MIDRAARALDGAPLDGIRLDDLTKDLLDGRFDVVEGPETERDPASRGPLTEAMPATLQTSEKSAR